MKLQTAYQTNAHLLTQILLAMKFQSRFTKVMLATHCQHVTINKISLTTHIFDDLSPTFCLFCDLCTICINFRQLVTLNATMKQNS